MDANSGDVSYAAAADVPPPPDTAGGANTSVGVSGELSTASLLGNITHFLLDLLRDVELLRSYTEQVRAYFSDRPLTATSELILPMRYHH